MIWLQTADKRFTISIAQFWAFLDQEIFFVQNFYGDVSVDRAPFSFCTWPFYPNARSHFHPVHPAPASQGACHWGRVQQHGHNKQECFSEALAIWSGVVPAWELMKDLTTLHRAFSNSCTALAREDRGGQLLQKWTVPISAPTQSINNRAEAPCTHALYQCWQWKGNWGKNFGQNVRQGG